MSYEKGYGQATAGFTVSQIPAYVTATAPAPPTRLSNCAGQLEGSLAQLTSLQERLSRLADRLTGSIPEEAQNAAGKLRGGGGGIAAQIEYSIEEIDAVARRTERAVERLEAL